MNKSGGFNFLPGLFFLKQGSQRTSLKMTGTDFIFSEFKCGQRSCLHILKKWAYLYIISIYKSIYSLYISTRALCLYYYNYYMTMLLYCLTCFAGDNCKEK